MEFEDRKWLPDFIRNAMTGVLGVAEELAGIYLPVAKLIADQHSPGREIQLTDMCSGSGQGTISVLSVLREKGFRVKAVLTDLYPNLRAARKINQVNPAIRYAIKPVDALHVPDIYPAEWYTVFAGFHHFNRVQKTELIEKCTRNGSKLLVVEGIKPGILTWIFAAIFLPFLTWFLLPLVRPFNWLWIPFTYILPIIPLLVWWDGLMSVGAIKASEKQEKKYIDPGRTRAVRGFKRILPGISVYWLLLTEKEKAG